MPEISNLSMLTVIIFVLIPVSLSYLYSLGIAKTTIWSSLRGIIQLILIGYVLTFLFEITDWIAVTLAVLVMISAASWQAGQRGKGIKNAFLVTFTVLAIIEGLVLILWIGFNIIPFESQQVIPMSGMVIGNSMVASALALERLKNDFSVHKGKVLAALSLGATPPKAANIIIRNTIKAAMIPSIDGLKTIGLVQLPGMMTGLIIGGASPIEAIRYQIVISLSIFASVSLTSMFVSAIAYRSFFNKDMQLVEIKEND
ncbi:ABC transporter permease [Pseudalkalibacillus caeni]|uniref:Iron export ABC transporter permease subunit FetB n=1 Tax=Exobacillus caeni TaxID=2574798 RepID=A0A5R9EVX7_9BACL|nr:iron export ABC transporter permease subunit FetB [Pseudalkalibacillus caeni]TLS35392.1 iron export ABC transporter permease subunit FetB [Pseudalkalibacillus caeni]